MKIDSARESPFPGQQHAILLWLFPDRGSANQLDHDQLRYWAPYTSAAAQEGLELLRVGPDQVRICHSAEGTRVWAAGRELDPHTTLIMADTATDPRQLPDLWPILSTMVCLEAAGFPLAVPTRWSLIGSDKLATHLAVDDPTIMLLPTLRLIPGPEMDMVAVISDAADLGFPVIVKPTSWHGGNGVCRVDTRAGLRQVLQLVTGYGQPFVIQRALTGDLVDARSYCVNGEVVVYVEREAAQPGEPANVSRGGHVTVAKAPAEVVSLSRTIYRTTRLAYFCLDMLHDGNNWWLSEIEPDGAISVSGGISEEVAESTLRARFAAYRAQLPTAMEISR